MGAFGRLAFVLLAGAILGAAASAATATKDASVEIAIGVLAYRGSEAAIEEWGPIVRRLESQIPERRVRLLHLDHRGMREAIAERRVAFVITNPGHYVELEAELGASRILTLDAGAGRSPERAVGAAVIAKRERLELQRLADLRGRRVAIVGRDAFGGFQAVWREMAALGMHPDDFAEVKVVGFPMDQVIDAVLRGEADAGIVRACLLESRPQWTRGLRVVAQRDEPGFPCATSTRLYPDWPLAALRHTPPDLAKAVAVALLGMSGADGLGWAVPADYQSVHDLFRELQIGPYAHLRQPTLLAIAERYWPWVGLLAFLILGWILYTVRIEHLVHARTAELTRALAEREALEARVRAGQEQADHMSRLSVLGELSGTLAHELNQPLAAIGNYAQSLRRRVENRRLTDEAVSEAAGEIAGQAERAAGILGRIRAFARKREALRETVDPAQVAAEAVALFRGMLAQAPAVEVSARVGSAARIEVDPLQIQQVLLNLLKNGYDAMRGMPRERQRLVVSLAPADGAVEIAVRDYGPGIDAATRDRLFEPFFTTKADGLGLGLSICRTIAEAHRGRLGARAPREGPGAEFVLTLPVAPDAS